MQVQPYLFFDGRCEEAVEFYRRALGAEVTMLMRFKDSPEPQQPGMIPPGAENKVMHVSFRIGDTTVLASDGRCDGQPSFQGFALSLTVRQRGRGRATLRCPGRRRAGTDATGQDVLFAAFRHGRRPLRRVVDGLRRGLTASAPVPERSPGPLSAGSARPSAPEGLLVALSRYWSGIVVDLSRPACGHVKEALKGREF